MAEAERDAEGDADPVPDDARSGRISPFGLSDSSGLGDWGARPGLCRPSPACRPASEAEAEAAGAAAGVAAGAAA
ncbi:hypothetical protein J7E87_13025, partial [Streptomyces sp. ISL-1]|uniref:hypothetical protein n=1 Tax=Streptomyces sp. ISL-1 TaxID=2817657 RepID=UPI001BE52A9A